MLPRQLYRRSADTATATMDEHGLAILQPAPRQERVVSGDEDLGDPARIDKVDVVWNPDHLGCAHRHELRIGATFDEEHDAIPDRRRANSGANIRDDTGPFETEDVAGAGRRWIETPALEQIGTVDAGTGHADHDLALSGDRVGAILDVKLLRPAWRRNDDGAHRSGTPIRRGGGQESWPAREESPTGPVQTGPRPAVLEKAANDNCQSPSPSEYDALYPVFEICTTSPGMLKL